MSFTHTTAASRLRRTAVAAGAAALALLLGACSGGADPLGNTGSTPAETGSGTPIIIGSANFSESMALAEIYAGALNAAGINAETRLSIGTREIYFPALEDGSIDAVPEYTGNLLLHLDPSAQEFSPEEITAALPEALPEELGILTPSQAEDKDTLVVRPAVAEEFNLESMEDLGPVCGQLIFGVPDEFKTRAYGLAGLEKNYDCVPKEARVFSDSTLKQKALLEGDIQVASYFTTDPAIADNGLVMLDDPKNNFPAQQVVPLIKKDRISDAAAKVFNDVSGQLTTQDLVDLNWSIDGDLKLDPRDAAKDWLTEKGFIK